MVLFSSVSNALSLCDIHQDIIIRAISLHLPFLRSLDWRPLLSTLLFHVHGRFAVPGIITLGHGIRGGLSLCPQYYVYTQKRPLRSKRRSVGVGGAEERSIKRYRKEGGNRAQQQQLVY